MLVPRGNEPEGAGSFGRGDGEDSKGLVSGVEFRQENALRGMATLYVGDLHSAEGRLDAALGSLSGSASLAVRLPTVTLLWQT